jgi:hypothetical protein
MLNLRIASANGTKGSMKLSLERPITCTRTLKKLRPSEYRCRLLLLDLKPDSI